jgi:hypothetical protein
MKKGIVLIPAFEREAILKRRLREHLSHLGFRRNEDGMLGPPSFEKSVIRKLHSEQRFKLLLEQENFVRKHLHELEAVLADGHSIDPPRIKITLQRVDPGTREARIFRLASLSWSVPVSNGFGRRLRYLVWDESHGCLVGLIALGDPVFNLRVRDQIIGWNSSDRAERLSNVMDAYVLGALPPYSHLLVGKAVACLVRTREVYEDFVCRYGALQGVISGKVKQSKLLAVTTSSSMGRSSIYNRLKIKERLYFRSIGYTEGWGHFHIPDDIFMDLREYLKQTNHPYVRENRFGQGPNWRLRTIREGLRAIGFSEDTLHHGIKREVFLCEFAKNTLSILANGSGSPALEGLEAVSEVAGASLDRWVLPRARRRPEFRAWKKIDLLDSLFNAKGRENIRGTNANRNTV